MHRARIDDSSIGDGCRPWTGMLSGEPSCGGGYGCDDENQKQTFHITVGVKLPRQAERRVPAVCPFLADRRIAPGPPERNTAPPQPERTSTELPEACAALRERLQALCVRLPRRRG